MVTHRAFSCRLWPLFDMRHTQGLLVLFLMWMCAALANNQADYATCRPCALTAGET